MMRLFAMLIAALAAVTTLPGAAMAAMAADGGAGARCAALGRLDFGPVAHVDSAAIETARARGPDVNWVGPPPAATAATLSPFCKLVAIATPTSTSHIRVEVWLPLSGWNGRMLGIGNGGYPDAIEYPGMAAGLARGFAVVSTDLGLAAYLPGGKAAPGADLTDIFADHPVAIRDFASRATHEMTLIGKHAILAFYGRAATWSYFAGCSTGGMQGMSESQRFPQDYDAILAGDPGGNRVRVHLGILWDFLSVWHRPDRVIPDQKLHLLHDAAVAECLREEHGPAGKTYLDRPEACRWDPRPLACKGADGPSCLTDAQLATALAIYAGPRNPRTGEVYMAGLLPGSELGWSLYMSAAAAPAMPYFGVFRAALGRALDPAQFDWDRDALTFIDVMGPQLDSADPDITAFVGRGGKLLFYFGGSDQLVPLTDIVDYRSAAIRAAKAGSSSVADAVQVHVIPGMNHCAGGFGPDRFDGLGALSRWRETGSPPVITPLPGDAS